MTAANRAGRRWPSSYIFAAPLTRLQNQSLILVIFVKTKVSIADRLAVLALVPDNIDAADGNSSSLSVDGELEKPLMTVTINTSVNTPE